MLCDRVANVLFDTQREKLLAQQREAEQREAEMQRKREAQAAVADRAYDEKVEKLRQQTQER